MNRYRRVDTLLLSLCDPAANSLLQLMTVDHGELRHDYARGPIPPNSYTDIVIRTGAPLMLRNAPQEQAFYGIETALIGGEREPLALVCVPLLNTFGQRFGMLSMQSYTADEYDLRDIDFLTNVAHQIALNIQNATLFKQSQEQVQQLAAETERLELINRVSNWSSATTDLRELFQGIVNEMARATNADQARLLLIDRVRGLAICEAELHDTGAVGQLALPIAGNPAIEWFDQYQTPMLVRDATDDPRFQAAHAVWRASNIRDVLLVPLLVKGEVIGSVGLDMQPRPCSFSEREVATCVTIANQVAQAIAHARLFDQIRRFNVELEQMVAERTAALTAEKERLEAVHTITTALTASLDIDEIVRKTLELAAGAIGVPRGSVLVRDPMRDLLIYRAVLSETEGLSATDKPFDLPSGNLVEWTLEHQQGVMIADVREDERWVALDNTPPEIRSFIAVPLLAADVPLGVLMLNSPQPGFFNDEHMRLLSTIASEVAITVHNAELYNYINEQATRLAELLQVQREETGKNRAILESVAEGVLVLDEADTVVLFNRAASQVLHIADDVVLGRDLRSIAEHGTGDEQERALPLYAALGEGVRGARQQSDPVNRLLELPGQTIDLTITPVTTPDGERVGIAVVLRDITREIESDKTKREFISTVSHELRTPLTSVKGYIDLLLLGTAGPISDLQKNFLQVVKSNADRLNSLVEDILEISRLENGKVKLHIKPLNLPDLINDIAVSLKTETERKRMQLTLEIEPRLPVVEADSKRINQVLTNLLSNAHKYTREGGQITVRAFERAGFIQVDVTDTGVGIPPDELPKMFSRFFRANNSLKEEVGGTGLGLSIAKSFVELHGGDMWVTSELEVGSTFTFTLPVEQGRPAQAEDAHRSINEVANVS